MTHAAAKHPGFTLLEVLAATAMVAMLAASLFASLHIAFKARRSATAAVESARKGNMAIGRIRADLQSAMAPNGILAGEFVGTRGGGLGGAQADTLSFYAAADDPAVGTGDVRKVEYVCEESSDGQMDLIRYVTTNANLAPTTPEASKELVARGLGAFTLRYYDGSAWQESWDSTTVENVLPKAIEATLEWAGESGATAERASCVLLIPCGVGTETASSSGGTP